MDLTLRFAAHPSEEVLEAYALKRLAEDHIPEVERHLLVCEACQHSLADLDTFIAAMKTVSPEAVPAPVMRPRVWPRWQTALAAAAVLAGAFFVWESSGTRPVPATIILSSMRGSQVASPTGPANTPLELEIASTQLDDRDGFRIDLVTAEGAPVWSGAVTHSAAGKPVVRIDKRLSAGSYWVRLYSPENQLLQEYGLQLK